MTPQIAFIFLCNLFIHPFTSLSTFPGDGAQHGVRQDQKAGLGVSHPTLSRDGGPGGEYDIP